MTSDPAESVADAGVTGDLTRRPWRVLVHQPRPGVDNMAIDEAVARSVGAGNSPPTLRFYAWAPPCVSLGRYQPFSAVNADLCDAQGIDIVRRPTGGRAILHADELTYSIATAIDDPIVRGRVLDSYLRLAEGLLAGLRLLGIEARLAPGTNRITPDASATCFEVPSAYEILAGGRKLIGSAQARKSGFVLQHGSLPLGGDTSRIVDLLALPSDDDPAALKKSLSAHAITVEEAVGRAPAFDEAAAALLAGFSTALGLAFEPGELNAGEAALAAELATSKYGSATWMGRPADDSQRIGAEDARLTEARRP